MEKFSDLEIIALKQFRQRISGLITDEYYRKDENLIRWLRARELDLDKAEEMLKNSMTWREENKIYQILQSGISMIETFPLWSDGVDREGRIVVTMPFGEWDVRKSVEESGPENFCRHMTQMLETMLTMIRKSHESVTTNYPRSVSSILIVDLAGFSLRQLANMKSVQAILQSVSKYEAHYPEIMHSAFFVNAPAIFSILFKLMKPLMTARTLNKIKIFSSNKDEWVPAVLEMVAPSEIRQQFGGTRLS